MQKRILVVDDDDMNLTRTRIILKNDYDVILVNSGMKALDTLKREKVDLVLLDIEMPNMDGLEALKTIKGKHADANIVMCSAMGQEAMVIEAIKSGAKDFIVKPFQPDRVLEAVKKVIG